MVRPPERTLQRVKVPSRPDKGQGQAAPPHRRSSGHIQWSSQNPPHPSTSEVGRFLRKRHVRRHGPPQGQAVYRDRLQRVKVRLRGPARQGTGCLTSQEVLGPHPVVLPKLTSPKNFRGRAISPKAPCPQARTTAGTGCLQGTGSNGLKAHPRNTVMLTRGQFLTRGSSQGTGSSRGDSSNGSRGFRGRFQGTGCFSSGIQNDSVVLPKAGRVGILVATDASHYLHLGVGVVGSWVAPISGAGCSNH